MKIIESEDFEEIGATYQCIEIERLNNVLKSNGVSDTEQRRAICGEFIASSGYFIDEQSFESQGKRYETKIFFKDSKGNRLMQNEQFSFHEYAYGDIDYYFDEKNEILDDVRVANNGAVDK